MSLIPPQTPSSSVQPVASSSASVVSTYNPNQTTTAQAGTTPAAPAAPAATSGTFPGAGGTSLQSQLQAVASQLKGITPAQFFAAYGITSSAQPDYLAGTSLNANAVYLAYYMGLGQAERQAIQDQMVSLGMMPAADANGIANSASLGTFKQLIGISTVEGTNVFSYLDQLTGGVQGKINAAQNQVSANLGAAQKALSAPEVVTQENPTTLSATLTNAFEQALGYSPDKAQIDSFISQVQSQDAQYANAPRAAAQQEIGQAKAETAALDALGPDDVDKVIQAYRDAVNGSGLTGAGTQQGPPNAAAGAINPAGVGPHTGVPGPPVTTTQMVPEGGIMGFLGSHGLGPGQEAVSRTVTTNTPEGSRTAPVLGQGHSTATPTYGGLFALSAADWKTAQADYAPAKAYTTPGAAPEAVQQAAFTALLLKTYAASHSWATAIAAVASGTPFGETRGPGITAFGNQVAAQVNAQIAALQTQINTAPPVTVKVTAPDATSEANLAAKQSDPTGYYAAQSASWGEVLNKMLSGSPSMYNQTTADTFTGPVSPALASTGVAP